MDADDKDRQLSETRFAAELRQQLETAAASAAVPERPRRRRFIFIAVAVVGAGLALGGAALAGAFDSPSHRPQPKMMYADEPGTPTPYATNAAGQTYGGAQEGPEADLQKVGAHRGENGYCWKVDLDGPFPMNPTEVEWLMAVQGRREVAVYESDGVTQVGIFIVGGGSASYVKPDGTSGMRKLPDRLAERPPAWLFDRMQDTAMAAGDAASWAWWTRTTAAEAVSATGDSAAWTTDPQKPVYLAVMLGDFTRWLWPLAEGETPPVYSWIYQVVDADSHQVEASGASAKPFLDAARLEMNIVGLRDRISWGQAP
jgi:hypothetical protein